MATNSEDEAEAEDEGDLRLLQRADGGRAVDVHGRPLHCSVADSTARRKEVSSDIHARPQFTRGLALYAAGARRDGGREGDMVESERVERWDWETAAAAATMRNQ